MGSIIHNTLVKKSILFALLMCLSALSLMAQEEKEKSTTEAYVGFIFAPSAVATFQNENGTPFSVSSPLYFSTAIAKDKWSIAPFYSFSSNGLGAFATYAITPEFGTYVAFDKALNGNTGFYSLGFTTPILEEYIQGYVEVGSTYGDDSTPFLGIGLYFNLLKSVKSW